MPQQKLDLKLNNGDIFTCHHMPGDFYCYVGRKTIGGRLNTRTARRVLRLVANGGWSYVRLNQPQYVHLNRALGEHYTLVFVGPFAKVEHMREALAEYFSSPDQLGNQPIVAVTA